MSTAKPAKATAEKATESTLPARLPTQLFHAGHHWKEVQHVAAAGVGFEQVCNPNYWQHVAALLKPRDKIEVVAEDGSFEALFRVVSAAKGSFTLKLIGYQGDPLLASAPAPRSREPAGNALFGVDFAKADKWRVVEKATKQVVSSGHGSAEEAQTAADNLLAARQAA